METLDNQAPNIDLFEDSAAAEENAENVSNQAPNTDTFEQNAAAAGSPAPDAPTALTKVFVVTEIWLPIPQENFRDRLSSCGVEVLAVFSTLVEANEYARRHIQQLEMLTKAPRKGGEDRGYYNLIPNEEDPFSGRYQETLPSHTFEDGTEHFKVYWGNHRTTMVRVDEKRVYHHAASAQVLKPQHEANVDNFRWYGGLNRIATQG